jgi:hypothetical protein
MDADESGDCPIEKLEERSGSVNVVGSPTLPALTGSARQPEVEPVIDSVDLARRPGESPITDVTTAERPGGAAGAFRGGVRTGLAEPLLCGSGSLPPV